MVSNLLTIASLGRKGVEQILALSERRPVNRPLAGKGVALYFEKPSARTRNSMELASIQLGAHPVYIRDEEVGLDTRESAEDLVRTLACYHSIVGARVRDHGALERMTQVVATPVLNMLSDTDHPLQALADLLTIRQLLGQVEGAKVAFIGDANNVARSLAQGCSLLGAELTIAGPKGFDLKDAPPGVRHTEDPFEAVDGAQIVYTDVWVSMGQDREGEARREALRAYQVDEKLMSKAKDAWFLHCLPARRGEEVVDEVIDGSRSAVWRQAENRMHTARGAMAWMLEVSP